jgi:hypothetical protein
MRNIHRDDIVQIPYIGKDIKTGLVSDTDGHWSTVRFDNPTIPMDFADYLNDKLVVIECPHR